MLEWKVKVKRLLKSELVKRGVSHADLAVKLQSIGVNESKYSIDSKMSRGSFSASFLLQCLYVIGCKKIEIDQHDYLSIAAEPRSTYKKIKDGKQS